jgi:hypothetical protein
MFRLRIFHSYEVVTIPSEVLKNFGLCSALRAFEQGGICITLGLDFSSLVQITVPLVTSYNMQGDAEDLF